MDMVNFMETELGNTMLRNGDDFVAWLSRPQDGDGRIEVSYNPDNYPSLRVRTCLLTDRQIKDHIQQNLVGWQVVKLNLKGSKALNIRDGVVQEEE